MFVSYNWLQNYFEKELPAPDKLADIITFSAFEIESVEKKNNDTLIDVKVLPDRACYALSHRGIAGEISAAIGEKIAVSERKAPEVCRTRNLSIKIKDGADCRRYVGRRVEKVSVGESPDWLKKRLESIGQRSINNIVDAANFVMFDMGQPLHAFDADKIKGDIFVRRAKKGEKIVTLDNQELELDEEILVIADDEKALAVAGIKGGKSAEVCPETKNLILEAANFNPVLIRKASEKLNVRTDASKRFENGPSSEIAGIAMNEFANLIYEIDRGVEFGETVDEYPRKQEPKTVTVSADSISKALGVKVPTDVIKEILGRLGIKSQDRNGNINLSIPAERMDLSIPEDIVEEVGRLYGYEKVKSVLPPKPDIVISQNKEFYWTNKIRSMLAASAFSEIMTSSFSSEGKTAILRPLASDKSFFRTDLRENMLGKMVLNSSLAKLLGLDAKDVKLFEIGKVSSEKDSEKLSLCLGTFDKKELEAILASLSKVLGVRIKADIKNDVAEIDLDSVLDKLPEPKTNDLILPKTDIKKFKPFSPYPFVSRDVAVFVSNDTKADEVWKIMASSLGKAGESLLVNHYLFDEFRKGEKTSYAFRLVFQSFERTLTDDEVNKIMDGVYAALGKCSGWQIR